MIARGLRGRQPGRRVGLELASAILQRTGNVARVEDAARELCGALRAQLRVARAYLIAPFAEGRLSAVGDVAPIPVAADPRILDWLGHQRPILFREELVASDGWTALAMAALLADLDADIALLLRERDSLIGLLVFPRPPVDPVDLESLCHLLRASATTVMLTAHLRANSAGLEGLTAATVNHKSVLPKVSETGKSIDPKALWKVSEAAKVGAKATAKVTKCKEKCIEDQLVKGHENMGVKPNDDIRPTTAGSVTKPPPSKAPEFE